MYLILAIFLSLPSYADITCTHPQVCNLFEKSIYPFKLEIDPHHFEPSIGEIKTLLSAEIVAFGPTNLNPWAQKIEINRKNTNKKNIIIDIPEEFKKKYGKKNAHMIEHFWLYPDILCSLVKDCKTKEAEQKINDLKNLIQGKYFVLTHDALAPLFESQGAIVTSLRTSTHNCEAQPLSLKILEQWRLENRRPIWLIEENVHTFQQLKGKIGKEDLVLKIDIIGRPGENPFGVFDKIYFDLEKVLNGKSNP